MTEKKTTKKTTKKEDEAEQALAELQQNALSLQSTAQNLANQLQQYMQLCKHYEQTINILTGRLQEQQRLVEQLNQQNRPEAS
jgi:peptidoglycan hydrolase CwlO-like protein|tara:strand:+ start:1336 stop:1584 length:249 start_codon:yes stop_codon:yes gene_type:complete